MPNEATQSEPHVLVVDDDAELCELMQLRLEHHGFQVGLAQTAPAALASLARQRADAVVLDLRLETSDGLDLLLELRDLQPDLPVIVLTAHGSIETAIEATRRGAFGFLTKPFRDDELLQKLNHAAQRTALRRELGTLRRMVDEEGVSRRLLGASPALVRARELISRVAQSDVNVLIQGESGTGKEIAARTIHEQSSRSRAPFVALNCGALPAELLETELFGHVRGAFTGAVRNKEGLLSAAEGGTLFLDEIGDAPPAVQVKLLRVLQERVYLPVGSTEDRATNVRILAATHRDLAQAVQAKTFREDLFYRLHVVPLTLPTLRDCREDIPLLFEVFLGRAAARHGVAPCHVHPDALRLLLRHEWPGNVRELQNVAEGATVLAGGGELDARRLAPLLRLSPSEAGLAGDADLTSTGLAGASAAAASAPAGSELELHLRGLPNDSFPSLRSAREAFDRVYLNEALRRSRGNVSAAAKLASRNRSDFHELLRRHDISAAEFRNQRPESRGERRVEPPALTGLTGRDAPAVASTT
ncbi:MAG TPA: sigma-54 dependent transcriptional regulator [Polyangiaceae bacterium]|nr:sigma-54 dependent transcriptional regulator [Polyangiaceae bacterium]